LHGVEEGGFGGDAGEEGAVAGGLFAPELEVGVVGAVVAGLQFGGDAATAALGGLAVFEVDIAIPVGFGFVEGGGSEDEGAALGGGEEGEGGFGRGGAEEVGDEDAEGTLAEGGIGQGGGEVECGGRGFGPGVSEGVLEGEIGGESAEVVEAEGAAEAEAAFDAEVDEFPGALGFSGGEEHGAGEVEEEVDSGGDFLAEELHGGVAGSGGGLPIDVAWVIAGDVGALVLEVDGAAGALAEDGAAGAAPVATTKGEAEGAGGGAHGLMKGAVIQGEALGLEDDGGDG
jgi:hypothetical protein